MDKELEKILCKLNCGIDITRLGCTNKICQSKRKQAISQIKTLCREKAKECVPESEKGHWSKYNEAIMDFLKNIDQKFKT